MKKLLTSVQNRKDVLYLAILLFILNSDLAQAGWLDPLKNKAKDAVDPIAFIGFCFGAAKLYAKDYVSGILAMVASILLFSADTILSSLH